MNISYQWLRSVAPALSSSPEELAERLAALGAPVESITDLAAGLEDVVVGKVLEAGQHPNADRLSLCKVDPGDGTTLQIVCGAPNVKTGLTVAVAPVGATIPNGLKLKKAKIRGEVSQGMICSARELGLGDEHDGILELSDELEVGTPFAQALALEDWCLDVEVTANRGDLLSHVGVAREVAPNGVVDITLPPIPGAPDVDATWSRGSAEASSDAVTIRVDDGELCPRYLGAVIRGVEVKPSPEWLQARLRAVGARPINNVVDATNYVLQELGQPMHAFDLATLGEGTVVVRCAEQGDTLVTLDGEKRTLSSDMLAICDAERPVAIAGVMGGQDTEVTEATADVLLECALFHPGRTRATRKALGMSTDASYRYERGVDPDQMEAALQRCVQLVLATAGGTLDGPLLDCHPVPAAPLTVSLRSARIETVLGIHFEDGQVTALLSELGFAVRPGADPGVFDVAVPGHRSYDVRREVDLIEEIARRYGYEAFPAELAPYRATTVPDHPLFALEDRLREELFQWGCYELSTPAFSATGEIELPNPVSATESHLRSTLVTGVVDRVRYNLARGIRDPRLFEVGTVFFAPRDAADPRPVEHTHVAVALSGLGQAPHWSQTDRPVDLWDVKGLFEGVVGVADEGASIGFDVPSDLPTWLDPEFGVLHAKDGEGNTIGLAGRVRAQVADVPAWSGPVWAAEVRLPGHPAEPAVPTYSPPPSHPAIERDMALLVPHGVAAADVEEAIRTAAGKLLEGVRLFDLYEGEGVPSGVRSIAYRLVFRARDRTLTDADVDPKIRRVLSRLKEEWNVQQRA